MSAQRTASAIVEQRLSALRGALLRWTVVSGGLSLLGVAAVWIGITFALDWWLHVPLTIRMIHLTVLLVLVVWLARRWLLQPLRRLPGRSGLALLYERAYPQLGQTLVSAVELDPAAVSGRERALREAILRNAEQRAATIEPAGVLRTREPLLRSLAGAGLLALLALLALTQPAAFQLYARRLFGSSEAWPRETTLAFELLSDQGRLELIETGERSLRFTKGGDFAVVIKAQGKVPDEVELRIQSAGGTETLPLPRSGEYFRTFLRSLADSVELSVRGGDDEDNEPRLRIEVLEPPDIEAIAVRVEPPAYSGLPIQLRTEPQIEALAGSRLSFFVATRPAAVKGEAELLPQMNRIALQPAEFPPLAEGAGTRPGYSFELTAERSLRYRFMLKDDNGLDNPDPGLYGVTVLADRAPEVELLSPARGEYDTVPGGWISLRVRADDDFGLRELAWTVSAAGTAEDPAAVEYPLEWRALSPEELGAETEKQPGSRKAGAVRAFARTRIGTDQLVTGGAGEGSQWQLTVLARDNCEPRSGEGRSSAVRVRVVSADEFLRRVQERLNRAQASTRTLSDLAQSKLADAIALRAVLDSSAAELSSAQRECALALTGARRVQGDARTLTRELTSLVEALLYSRIDERSQGALEAIDARLSQSVTRGFDPAPWRDLADARRRGELAAGAFAAKLVEINGVALEISEDHARSAVDSLASTQQAEELASLREALGSAQSELNACVLKLAQLSELLAEWDNFQTVLNLTRDILGGQKTLNERTKQYAKEN